MGEFLDRYRAGEHVSVVAELCALGAAVREADVFDDARAVARAMMRRARHNLELLHERLIELGFDFARPDEAFVLARPETAAVLDEIEQRAGPLPMTVRAWYEVFDSVDLTQTYEQRRGELGPRPVQGLGFIDAMQMQPLRRVWEEFRDEADAATPVYLPVGPVLSNCDTACVTCPSAEFDELDFAMDGREDSSFVTFLRELLEGGGFPFWMRPESRALPEVLCPRRPLYDELLPILTEGFRQF